MLCMVGAFLQTYIMKSGVCACMCVHVFTNGSLPPSLELSFSLSPLLWAHPLPLQLPTLKLHLQCLWQRDSSDHNPLGASLSVFIHLALIL